MSIPTVEEVLGRGREYIPVLNMPQNYPVSSLPSVLQNVVQSLHEDTQIPIELIGSTVLAAASLACQALVEIVPPYKNDPEQCSLYFITLAESGEGKTTIYQKVMKPFEAFSVKMKQEYNTELAEFKKKHRVWTIQKQAKEQSLKKAIRTGDSEAHEEPFPEERLLEEHYSKEPSKPRLLKMLYEDATPKALIQGLSEYSNGALFSDEAITFFKGYVKRNLGLLNKSWDGGTYAYERPDGESYDLKACLTISLMVQPGVFMDYLKKHGELAESSGFLSRFLFANTISTVGSRYENQDRTKSDAALKTLHSRLSLLLDKQYENFKSESPVKKTLSLADDALTLWGTRRKQIESGIAPGEKRDYLRNIAAKAGSNAIRLAAIFTYMENENAEMIRSNTLNAAYDIVLWHLGNAHVLFYPMSERYQFDNDVYELFDWIKGTFANNYGFPFKKNEIEKLGPNRLRRIEKLEPVLNQLISMGLILVIRCDDSRTLYIAKALDGGNSYTPPPPPIRSSVVSDKYNTPGKQVRLDEERLSYTG